MPRLEVLEDHALPSTFTVLNLLDSGPDSLRAAVVAANANPGADTIDFAVTGTIGLTSGQLDITDSLTINGPGAGALTVSGNSASRVFGIAGDPTVSIANLTVANGSATDTPGGGVSMAGGGIFMAGGTVTLDHVTVTGNSAVGSLSFDGNYYSVGDGLGGGLYVAGGTLTLDQCTVSGNYAAGGAGLSDFYRGYNGGNGAGGGLYIAGGTVHVNQSTVSGNGAYGGRGGDGLIWDWEQTFGGSGGAAAGGGISVAAGSLEIHQSSIFNNSASGGAGGQGYSLGSYPEGPSGGSEGGGLFIASAAPPLADLDTFTESHTINNSDPNISGPYSLNGTWIPPLAISGVSILEGNSGTTAFVFTVYLSAPSNQAVSVNCATADGTATAGSDYQAASGTLTIPAGQTTGTITVLVNGDRLVEPDETFFVHLSGATNATITNGQGTGWIWDDEPRISIGDRTVTEGNTGSRSATFTVYLSTAYDVPVSVNYATANGTATAGSDYQAATGTLTIPAGQMSGTITVLVSGDRLAEANEAFAVNLINPVNASITDGRGVGTIVDDEPRISIGTGVSKAEGRKNHTTLFTFTVRLSAAYDQAVTMSFRTTDGSATTSDNDYVAKTGTITFAPGETTKTITIEVKGDSKREADEYFFLDLVGNSSNSLFTIPRGIGTILNDD